MTRERPSKSHWRVAFLGTSGTLLIAVACASSPDNTKTTTLDPSLGNLADAPSFNDYKNGPDGYLALKCATLDCHGQVGRGMRLYSVRGLRSFDAFPPGDFPNLTNGRALQPDELAANYQSVIGLEPETMAQVYATQSDPTQLLLFKKPLGLEGHKGGQVMQNKADPGYKCLASWVVGDAGADGSSLDTAACAAALAVEGPWP
jgi:hypothetical protein